MKRQLLLMCLLIGTSLGYIQAKSVKKENDRTQWVNLAYQIAEPVLKNMSKGELQKNMQVELSPRWDNRNMKVTYMETFGRLMAGIAPWLALEDDNTPEGKKRAQLRQWALASYKKAVDPTNPDYLQWEGHSQPLVDAAYIAESFIRAPKALWEPLDQQTKNRYIHEFKRLRRVEPPYNNWLLFRGMVEAFLASIGEDYDGFAVRVAINKINEWYVGDGFYNDGPIFGFDYYNSYVIHPMLVEVIETLNKRGVHTSISLDLALRRMQRFNSHIERLISPEGTYPAFGRSVTYRLAAFQSLALSAWKYGLPKHLTNGQVRSALTTVMKRMFAVPGNFNEKGYLSLGFVGHQPDLADYYTNNGSMYMTSLVFLPLGLPESHPFWTDKAEPWTQVKAWSGQPFTKDYAESIMK